LKHKERMAVNKTVLRVLVGEYKKKNWPFGRSIYRSENNTKIDFKK
jgi:hypothetical protein